ncbi:hypoxanthine phosphoribosyltransferase [Puniceicoccales bacterium CK1056]|uniref:Hypoxanthine phosphoribosyltransferase n=2 Tax=Oceanipulchritudo coccoides TaxID=2706888 RepID=A0A6B2LYN9_9BACT|nr:hypoxanthine phosphoribosyltransferase [Oceanipulchritudo coccoides]
MIDLTSPQHPPLCAPLVAAMFEDLESILVTEQEIRERVAILGQEITETYRDADELTVIAIINGALLFTADLIRQIDMPVRVDCMRVSSYRNNTSPVQEPEIIDMLRLDLRDQHVLIIDDILDTGHTFMRVVKEISKLKPASIRFGALLEKEGRREVEAHPDFVGFSIPDQFVVGYGLDFAERYRQLSCIGVLKSELQNPPSWA